MNAPRRDIAAHLLRVAACLLLLVAGAVAQRGRALGAELRPAAAAVSSAAAEPAAESGIRLLPDNFEIRRSTLGSNLRILAVLLLAAVVPLFTKSRRWRTVQLWLDLAVLGLWTGSFLSTARLVGWAGSGLPGGFLEWTIALLLLSMAFLYPVFGRASHYCLHVCPFGAAQELAARLPAPKARLSPALVRRLAAFRSALWAALLLATLCGAWARWMEWELFGALAFFAVPPLVAALAAVFVALSVFVPRAYCRFVCPTGTLFKLAESDNPDRDMKTANLLNVLLAVAIVLLCAKLHFRPPCARCAQCAAPAADAGVPPAPDAEAANATIDSTGLAPGVSGYGGPVPVEVEIRDGVVARVSPKLPNDETPMFFARLEEAGLWKAWDGLPVEVAATARVDAVTSATYSSEAAIANVRAALAAAAGTSPDPN